jgi:hypothetical protein
MLTTADVCRGLKTLGTLADTFSDGVKDVIESLFKWLVLMLIKSSE